MEWSEVVEYLNRCRKRILPSGGVSFEVMSQSDNRDKEIRHFFESQGAAVGSPFLRFSEGYIEVLKQKGVDLTRNAVDIRQKYR